MDGQATKKFAEEVLGLSLSNTEAEDLAQRLGGLRLLVEQIERIPLPYLEDPFTTPRSAEQWLESWAKS
jgi:hypothetical protein